MRDSRTLATRVKRLEEASNPGMSKSAKLDKYMGLLAEFGTPPNRIADHRQTYRHYGEEFFWEWMTPGEAAWVHGRLCLDAFPELEGRTAEELRARADGETDELLAMALRCVANLFDLRDPVGKTCGAGGLDGKPCRRPAARRDWWFTWVCAEHVRPESAPGPVN